MSDGKADVVSVDFSVQCVEECRRRYASHPGMSFEVMDVRALDLPPDSFDLAIDKACLDCLHCSDSPQWAEDMKAAVAALLRCLKTGGTLLSLSHSPPEQRSAAFLLEQLDLWKDALQHNQKEKEKQRRASALALQAGGTPPSQPASRRSSVLISQVAMLRPTAAFAQPIVHRLSKPNHRTSTTAERSAVAQATSGTDRAEATLTADDSDVEAALNLSAVEEVDHYLYVVRKEAAQRSVVDGIDGRTTPGNGRRGSALMMKRSSVNPPLAMVAGA